MIQHDKLCHSSASNVTGFLAARVILGHLVSCPLSRSRIHSLDSCATSCNICANAKNVAFCCIALHGGQKKKSCGSI